MLLLSLCLLQFANTSPYCHNDSMSSAPISHQAKIECHTSVIQWVYSLQTTPTATSNKQNIFPSRSALVIDAATTVSVSSNNGPTEATLSSSTSAISAYITPAPDTPISTASTSSDTIGTVCASTDSASITFSAYNAANNVDDAFRTKSNQYTATKCVEWSQMEPSYNQCTRLDALNDRSACTTLSENESSAPITSQTKANDAVKGVTTVNTSPYMLQTTVLHGIGFLKTETPHTPRQTPQSTKPTPQSAASSPYSIVIEAATTAVTLSPYVTVISTYSADACATTTANASISSNSIGTTCTSNDDAYKHCAVCSKETFRVCNACNNVQDVLSTKANKRVKRAFETAYTIVIMTIVLAYCSLKCVAKKAIIAWFIAQMCLVHSTNAAFYQKLIADDHPIANQWYGRGTAIANTTAFIGAYGDNNFKGAVYVFQKNVTTEEWEQKQKMIPSDEGGGFGYSIDFDAVNNAVIIGAYSRNSNRGGAYVFTEDQNGDWKEEQILIPAKLQQNDFCGLDVAIDNNVAVIGCERDDDTGTDNGAIFIFEYNGMWEEAAKITATDPTTSDNLFGFTVDIRNGVIVVGASGWGDTNEGAAYIIEKEINWKITQRLYPSDAMDYAWFGYSVSIYKERILIGTVGYNGNIGKVFIYEFNATSWIETSTITASDGESDDYFGSEVSLFNDTLAVGAFGDDGYGLAVGAVYLFEYIDNKWFQTAKLSPPGSTDAEARHFNSVSLYYNGVLIGARYDDTGGAHAGSAHIYERYADDLEWLPTQAPSNAPTQTNETPSNAPSQIPTKFLSAAPSNVPTQTAQTPNNAPSQIPTKFPSAAPSNAPIETVQPRIDPVNTTLWLLFKTTLGITMTEYLETSRTRTDENDINPSNNIVYITGGVVILLLVIIGVTWYYHKINKRKLKKDLEIVDKAQNENIKYKQKNTGQKHQDFIDHKRIIEVPSGKSKGAAIDYVEGDGEQMANVQIQQKQEKLLDEVEGAVRNNTQSEFKYPQPDEPIVTVDFTMKEAPKVHARGVNIDKKQWVKCAECGSKSMSVTMDVDVEFVCRICRDLDNKAMNDEAEKMFNGNNNDNERTSGCTANADIVKDEADFTMKEAPKVQTRGVNIDKNDIYYHGAVDT